MPSYATAIHWFRRDLRLSDNPALFHAVKEAEAVVPVYIQSVWKGPHAWTGPGRQAFLCGNLASLARNLEHIGGALFCRRGEARGELEALIRETKAEAVYFNRDPDPYGRAMEATIRELCREYGIACHEYQEAVLHEPLEVLTGSGLPYKVYTPYSRNWFGLTKTLPLPAVKSLRVPEGIAHGRLPELADWGLEGTGELPLESGEKAARARLKQAVEQSLSRYEERRNDPAADATSHLGADLRYGTISVREVYHRAAEAAAGAATERERKSIFTFQKQLAWREFFMAVLHHYPEVLETDFNPDWRGLEWDDPGAGDRLERWKEGRTGFPIVDAGMRQLLETGYMHNRVRMITAMFLTKDLHLHWMLGESHFMQHLLDGEIANNNGGWQWSAGTGADAAPYFRIQNPWTQTATYDPEGIYIKRWLPELAKVDPKRFLAPPAPGTRLCADYVAPIVDHKAEREVTLERFKRWRAGGER
jgi:deoxyribodipyrimidine photo-lyase